MVQIHGGRAGLVRLPVIPSPSGCGHGVVRWQHAGPIKRATTPMVRGSDNCAAARGLRPECSRRPGTIERADVAVAQPVVDQREQFACRGDLGDVLAAASFDALFVGRDLGRRRVALHRLDRRPADRFGALFGDVSAVHDGVGLAVARGQPGP